jgi:hypothetical protein
MKWPDIAYLDQDYPQVPKWFTVLVHLYSRRQCRKVGHQGWSRGSAICGRCGLIYRG